VTIALKYTKHNGVTAMLDCIWEGLSLNFSQDTSNFEIIESFPQSLWENARIMP
jgi:hypothetical protein